MDMTAPTTITALGLDQFVNWVKNFVGHSKDWTTDNGFDYQNIYNDQLQFQAVTAFLAKHNSELISQSMQAQEWVPYAVYTIAIELLIVILIVFKIYRNRARKYRYMEHLPTCLKKEKQKNPPLTSDTSTSTESSTNTAAGSVTINLTDV